MILVYGEVVLDVLRDPGRDRRERPAHFIGHPGGSPANTAVALARLGSSAALGARISRNTVGALLREHLIANGVDLNYAVEVDEPASVAFVEVNSDGGASYSFYTEGAADWQWTDAELGGELPTAVQVIHTGSIAVVTPPGRDAIGRLLTREHDRRMVSLDPNIRPALIGAPEDARATLETLMTAVHLVKVSEEDLAWLYAGETFAAAAERWCTLGPTAVIVTRGPEGAVGFVGGTRLERPARDVRVVDTVGAGDAYSAGLLHYLERDGLIDAVRRGTLTPDALGSALDFAGAVAALACARAGADPPRSDEVATLMAAG